MQKLKDSVKDLCSKTIKKKNLYTMIITFAIIIGIPSYIAFINVWAEDKAMTHKLQKYTLKDDSNERQERIARLEEQWKNVQIEMNNLRAQQIENTKEIIETIKRLGRNNNIIPR